MLPERLVWFGVRQTLWLTVAFVVLLLNSAYLAASASASLFYFANVAFHAALGVVITGLALTYLRGRAWRLPVVVMPGVILLGLGGALSGLAITGVGATRPYRWLLAVHIACSVAGAIPVFVWLLTWTARRSRVAAAAMVVVVAGAAVSAGAARLRHEDARRAAHRIENPRVVPASMEEEGAGAESPFFPSSSDTNVGGIIPADFFLTSDACGRCHTDVYEQWNSSAHHFSSFNNQWYRKSIEYMQDVVGTTPSKWCAGCHDHAVFFNGRFDRPMKEQIDTPEAQAGLACTSCHAITHVGEHDGSGGHFVVEYPPLHDLAASDHPVLRAAHDWLLNLDPQPHRETFMKPFHRETDGRVLLELPQGAPRRAGERLPLDPRIQRLRQLAGVRCLRPRRAVVLLPGGVSDLPRLPHAAGAVRRPGREGRRDPVAPVRSGQHRAAVRQRRRGAAQGGPGLPARRTGDARRLRCGPDGGRRPHARGRERGRRAAGREHVAVGEESLAFGARRVFIAPAGEVEGPLGAAPVYVRPGDSVRLEVVVRTRKVGHFFPAGTVDAFDVWVELDAVDSTGRRIFHSGALDGGNGPVDRAAHFYRSLLLDEHGNPINKRNAWAARSVAYVRLIPPGAADTVHYRLEMPEDVKGPISLTARLNYRKFAWWNTQWAFAGGQGSHPAGLRARSRPRRRAVGVHGRCVEGVRCAEGHSGPSRDGNGPCRGGARGCAEGRRAAGCPSFVEPSVRERWNDYGIGLLLQGDLKGAEAAFVKVTEAEAEYVDGWVNLGRVRVQEGNVEGAEEVLRTALAMDPTLGRTHFFLALALKGQGYYDTALAHLEHAATAYPRDRVVRNQMGRLLFLQRQYAEAVRAFEHVLAIDPEDLQAHYNLMLCYRGLGEPELAERERQLYARFKRMKARRRSPGRIASSIRTTTTSDSRSTKHRNTLRLDAGDLSGAGSYVPPLGITLMPVQLPASVVLILLVTLSITGISQPLTSRRSQGAGPSSAGLTFTDVTEAAGITVQPHQRRVRGEVHAGDLRLRRALARRRRGWVAGRAVGQWDGLARARRRRYARRALSQRRRRHVHRRHARLRSRRPAVWHGRRRGRFRQRRACRCLSDSPRPNRLLKGRGDGTFTDVTAAAGVGDPSFSTSALWFDYDKDGHLDLFVGNYVEWSPDTDLFCSLVGDTKSYCQPESYQGQSPTLYRNRGDQTFEDVTTAAGLRAPSSKALGVAMLDFDGDGWMDLFVANDTQPNQLYRNRGDGTFEDVGGARRCGLQRGGRGTGRDGSGRGRLRSVGTPRRHHRQFLNGDDGPSITTRGTVSSSTRVHGRRSAARRCRP